MWNDEAANLNCRVPRRRLSAKPKNLKSAVCYTIQDITIVIDLSEIRSDVTGKVVCFLIEEPLRKRQTGVVEFKINMFAEEITNDIVKNMFEIIHSSPNRNTVANNGKGTDIKYHKQPDISILTSFSGAVHKVSGQKEPLVLRKIIDGSTIMVTSVVDLSELRSYAHSLKNTMGEEKVADQIDAPEIPHRRDVVIIPNGIELRLAVVLALLACCCPLACCWLLVRYDRKNSLVFAAPSLIGLGSCGTLHPPQSKARVQTAKQASSSAAGILLVVLILVSTASVTGAEKLRPWRPVGFNPVLDVSPGAREYGRMVSFRDMVFLWGGTNPDTGKAGECAFTVDREAQHCLDF